MNIAESYTHENGVYKFIFSDESEVLIPENAVILVDDNDNLISVKNTATRKTAFLVKKN